MAHECPDCYQTCHCGGDVDDCDFGELVSNCTHCPIDGWDDEDDDYDWEDRALAPQEGEGGDDGQE